uniref:Uncharacterized protein n=1 Tax=uncultured marine virus TaxID=186617 RepID=A0A0F7L1P6_9VIRU|nr:hypothetical protein [uncultured marine virus]
MQPVSMSRLPVLFFHFPYSPHIKLIKTVDISASKEFKSSLFFISSTGSPPPRTRHFITRSLYAIKHILA